MAVREVLKMGDPRLAEVARPVTDFASTELGALLVDMHDTMAAQNGAGLAAPQIGVPLRVVVFGYDTSPRYPEAPPVPPTILINPEIEPLGDAMETDWEGCLSVPGMRGLVARHQAVRYRGFDQRGRPIEVEATGFHARVVQHECDHLDGVLYPQRVQDLRDLGFSDALARAGRFSGGAPCDDPPE